MIFAAELATVPPDSFGPSGTFNPAPEAGKLLGYLAWTLTAAAVGGVVFVGIQMSLQLRREPGEGANYYRGLVMVMFACVLGVTAGPLVEFLIVPFLL